MEPKPVTVNILDREYRFACQPEERQQLMEAASLLDESMREVRDRGRLMALERIAIMAALNFAGELIQKRKADEVRNHSVDDRLHQLAERLDDALSTRMD